MNVLQGVRRRGLKSVGGSQLIKTVKTCVSRAIFRLECSVFKGARMDVEYGMCHSTNRDRWASAVKTSP